MELVKSHPQLRTTVVYLIQAAVAFVFLRVGVGQITGDPTFSSAFDTFDNGNGLRVFIGALELLGAALLLSPGFSAFAAAALAALMLLAGILGMGTYSNSPWLWSGVITGGVPLAPNLLLIVCLAIAWWRRDQFARVFRSAE